MNTVKTIVYDYSFNSSKKTSYNGKIVDGADLKVSILAFNKKGVQVELVDGMKTSEEDYLCDAIRTYIGGDNLLGIECRQDVLDALYRDFGITDIYCNIVGYYLSVIVSEGLPEWLDAEKANISQATLKVLNTGNVSECLEVDEPTFKSFVRNNFSLFDNSGNYSGECLAWGISDIDLNLEKSDYHFVASIVNKCCIGESGDGKSIHLKRSN